MLFKASAPGSLMLLGEYAVLHRKLALVCAVDKRMHVSVQPRADRKIFITSALGSLETDLNQLVIAAPFQFVLASLIEFKKHLRQGCDITIESEFSSTIGFASSAAVTVACVKALVAWLDLSFTDSDLIRSARKIVRNVQGLGSGADVAACVLGGMVSYRAEPLSFEKLASVYPLTVIYSGKKTPTVEAVQTVQKKFSMMPQLFKQILSGIHQCASLGVESVRQKNWVQLGEILNVQQGLMDALGVNTTTLNHIIDVLRLQPAILGAKISGSGLGDCVVALGNVSTNNITNLPSTAQIIQVAMSQRGVECEKS